MNLIQLELTPHALPHIHPSVRKENVVEKESWTEMNEMVIREIPNAYNMLIIVCLD